MKSVDPQRSGRAWRPAAGVTILLLGLSAATYPAWRVLLLGARPTLDELLRQTCSATAAAGPPDWLIKRLASGSAWPTPSPALADSSAFGNSSE